MTSRYELKRHGCWAAVALLIACATPTHWAAVAYQPRGMDLETAAEQLQRTLLTGRELSPIGADVSRHHVILQFYQELNNRSMLAFREVATIQLLHSPELNQYDVAVKDAQGRPLYRYTALNRRKAETFIEALAAMVNAAPR
jgi:hypothetical protein